MERIPEKTLEVILKRYRLKPGNACVLRHGDPADSGSFKLKKRQEKKLIEGLLGKLAKLQELLYAQHKHKVLIVLQGMDTAGKDGTIAHVFKGVNPQGVRVASFKAPTHEELDFDYLWRVHKEVPKKGQIVIFNRSHYEDVLATRVHKSVPPAEWRRRFAQINAFERMLSEEGTLILKFFLHIDKDEQKKRLEERLQDPHKHWKFNTFDINERTLWPHYIRAYEDALSATSTEWAPWFIIPANKKWHRNVAVSLIIIDALMRLRMQYPAGDKNLKKITIV